MQTTDFYGSFGLFDCDSCGFTLSGTNQARVTLFQDIAMLKYVVPYRYLVYKVFGHPAPLGNSVSLGCVNIW